MAELVDAPDSKSGSARSVGSIPTRGTKVQAYDIPPEISELQNKNFQLQNKNDALKKKSFMAFSVLAVIIIIGLTAINHTSHRNDES